MTEQKHGIVDHPNHPLPRSFVEPIIFLAEQMAKKDRILPPPKPRMVDQLADAVGLDPEQRRRWFHDLDDDKACEKIDLESAKRGALVVLALVLKMDTNGGEEAQKYFTSIRKKLEMDSITVPADLEEHKELALEYLSD